MKKVKHIARALTLPLLMICTISWADKVPLEVFGHLPTMEDMAISPDGTHIACIKTTGDDRLLLVVRLSDMNIEKQVKIGQNKARRVIWADDQHLLIETSSYDHIKGIPSNNFEYFFLLSYDLPRNRIVNPIHIKTEDLAANTIWGQPMIRTINGNATVFVGGLASGSAGNYFRPVLFKFSVGDERSDVAMRIDADDADWILDKDGEVIATRAYDEDVHQWSIHARVDGKLKQAANGQAVIERPEFEGASPDGESIWYTTLDPDYNSLIYKSISMKDGSISDLPRESKQYSRMLVSIRTGRVIGGYGRVDQDNDEDNLTFFDSAKQESWSAVEHAFSGESVRFISASADFKKILFLVEGTQHGHAYILFDVDKFQFKSLGKVYDGLTQFAQVKSITYKAADGFMVPAFLTIPPDRELKKLPLIVLPHGGPAAHDTGHFDWWSQALAQQGYLVLQPNFRGSDINWKFMSAGFGEWGGKMQTDLSDGVRQLVHDGLVDPQRVCIVGASYGGYAALAGASIDTGMYRCAVSDAGVSDLQAFIEDKESGTKHSNSTVGRYFDRYIGAKGLNDPILKDAFAAAKH